MLAALLGYLAGSVPFALLVARRHGVDLYRTGDGNPGAWNALEQLGARRAWPAFAGDGLKGALAGLAGLLLGGFPAAVAGVSGAMAGHAFPLFARLRGGKAVMTFAGGMFALAPIAAVLALAICLAVTGATRSFAHGARAGVFGVVPIQLLVGPVDHVIVTGALMTFVGALFFLRRGGRATSGGAARPTP